jgi:hypothetical protein
MRAPLNTVLTLSALALALLTAAPAGAAGKLTPARAVAPKLERHYLGSSPRAHAARARQERKALRARRRRALRDRHPHQRPAEEAPAPAPAPEPASAPAPSAASTPQLAAEPAPAPSPAPEPTPAPASEPRLAPLLATGFEQGLVGWNTAGVGESMPTVVSDTMRSGSHSAEFLLSGDEDRSELILGGSGSGDNEHAVRFYEGDEYWYGFSFYIVSMVYGRPGAHNLIMQFKGNDDGSPAFGLQLWDYEGDDGEYAASPKGLWSHGSGMGGDRFLAPAAERTWHDVAIHFKVSRVGAGFYQVYLDGKLVDSRERTSMLMPEASLGYIKDGIYRNGGAIPGTSEIRLDDARLGTSLAAVSAA